MNGEELKTTDFGASKVNKSNDEKTEQKKEPFDLVKSVKAFFAFFTVEPYLLCYILAAAVSSITTQLLNIEKACRADLNYAEEICKKALTGGSDNITEEARLRASELVTHMTAWTSPLQRGVPAIFILFIGAWSDKTGNRKVLMLIPLVGEFLSLAGLLAGTYFFLEWPLWVIGLIEASSSIFTGGIPVSLMASFSYLADLTTPETRTFRIGLATVIVSLGFPMGAAVSGSLTKAIGYYGTFIVSMCLYAVGFVYTVLKIHDVRNTKLEGTFCHKFCEFFHPRNLWDTISILFTSRGKQLAQILLVIWAHIFLLGPSSGEGAVVFQYALNKYKMDSVDYSLYSAYSTLMGIAGTSIAITVFSKWLKFHDAILGLIATCSKVASSTFFGLAPTRNWFYAGPAVDFFGNGVPAVRSLGTKVVRPEDVGKMCSLMGFVDSLVHTIFIPMYATVFKATLMSKSYLGATYILGAIMTAPDFIIFTILYHFYKKQRKDEVKNPETKEMHVYDNDISAI